MFSSPNPFRAVFLTNIRTELKHFDKLEFCLYIINYLRHRQFMVNMR